jgi:predicted secreted protein
MCLVFSAVSQADAAAQWSRSYHKLVTGSQLELVLEANPSTGFDWSISNDDEQYVAYLTLLQKEFIANDAPNQAVGVPGKMRFVFQVNKAIDPVVLLFTYKRPWEPDNAAAYHVATVTIVDAASRKICQPSCLHSGTSQEGWYSSCTQELIKNEKCAGLKEPYCGALRTRSEGWYSDKGLIQYDRCFDDRIPVPKCINEGLDNEGWDLSGEFVKASCQGLKMACAYPGSKSEGFWAVDETKRLTHVQWTLCMLEDK